MSTGLTLYDIETDLLNLMQCRESLLTVDDGCTPAEREAAVKECEAAIHQRVTDLVRKVDGAAFYLREFEARALAAKAEKQRLGERERMWEARRQRLEGYIIAVMQTMGRTRLEGDSNTLKLAKNPPSVEIVQPDLVTMEYCSHTVKMPQEVLSKILDALEEHAPQLFALLIKLPSNGPEPSKSKIAEALKRGDGVPGCSLVKDKVRLVVE